jgi:hypothetical protein
MGLSRSTFYDASAAPVAPYEVLDRIGAICDESKCYGYRRVGAALRHQGVVVNHKKLRCLMREDDLQPKQRRRYVVTTDSNHTGPVFRDLAQGVVSDRPNQLLVADLIYVAILDAWARKVVGYAIGRSMDARIAVAALKAAIRSRNPANGCIQHSDRGSQRVRDLPRVVGRAWPGEFDGNHLATSRRVFGSAKPRTIRADPFARCLPARKVPIDEPVPTPVFGLRRRPDPRTACVRPRGA